MLGMSEGFRHRWSQFGIRGLLVALTVLAVCMAWLGSEWRIVQHRSIVLDEILQVLRQLPSLSKVTFDGTSVSLANEQQFRFTITLRRRVPDDTGLRQRDTQERNSEQYR